MKKLLVFIFALAFISCETQEISIPVQKPKMVKRIIRHDNTSTIYKYNTDSTLSQMQYLSASSAPLYTKYFFYENGIIIKSEAYDFLNRLDFEELYIHSDGQLKEIQAKNHDTEMIKAPNDINIRFNYTNKVITSIEYEGAGAQFKEFLKYDVAGNVVAINREYNPENAISNTETKYTYDDKNHPFKSFNPILIASKFLDFELKSNVNNPIMKVTTFLSSLDSILVATSYEYDANLYPIEIVESVVGRTSQFTYEYYE
ncbi:hypothetical protein SAMN06298216_4131 [Spirosomataceae bacterium TFI 002]|nr:hypothetical protein SAMN06298216_4131 [Spirosomataceae bacterium TFI 002]